RRVDSPKPEGGVGKLGIMWLLATIETKCICLVGLAVCQTATPLLGRTFRLADGFLGDGRGRIAPGGGCCRGSARSERAGKAGCAPQDSACRSRAGGPDLSVCDHRCASRGGHADVLRGLDVLQLAAALFSGDVRYGPGGG